jgi:MFS family permease
VYFITLYMQRVLHFSPLQAGLALLPATLTVMATSTLIARRAVARFGAKTVLVAAMISIGLGQVWLSQISAAGSYPVNVLAGLVLTAFGMGLLMMDNSKKREARPAVARVRTGADSRR